MKTEKQSSNLNSAANSVNVDLAKLQVSIVKLASIVYKKLDRDSCEDIAICWSYLRQLPRLTPEREIFWEALHTYYIDGYPMSELARLTKISIGTISNNFRAHGLFTYRACRRTAFGRPRRRKYSLNVDALSEPSSPLTAYVLGFLWADGSLMASKSGKGFEGVRVVLKESDSEHLKFLRAFFKSTAPIRFFLSSTQCCGARFNQCGLALYSKDLADQLLRFGFATRRGGVSNAAPPAAIRENGAAFWRGMIDGDGCIRRDQRVRFPLSGWSIELAANFATAELFRDFISSRLPEAKVDIRPNGVSDTNYRVSVTGPHAVHLINFLYQRNHVALRRKARLASWLREGVMLAERNGVRIGFQGSRAHWIGSKAAKAKVALALPAIPRP